MQCARAVTDVASEMINVIAFALASLIGALILLTTINGSITGIFLVWLVVYIALIAWAVLVRVRGYSSAS